MSAYSIYRTDTGQIVAVIVTRSPSHLDANVPAGCSCLPGRYDSMAQRVDHVSGQVLDYQPPRPSPQHEWRSDIKRWAYVPTPLEVCLESRRQSYPPLADLADAMYWQARGNAEPMQRYLAAVEAVKQLHPKP